VRGQEALAARAPPMSSTVVRGVGRRALNHAVAGLVGRAPAKRLALVESGRKNRRLGGASWRGSALVEPRNRKSIGPQSNTMSLRPQSNTKSLRPQPNIKSSQVTNHQ
jgi:hypothetical protein